jgi:hypothetical protein
MNTDDFSHSDDQLCRKQNLGYRRRRRVVLMGRFIGAMFGAVDAAKERWRCSGREETTTMELFSLSLSLSLSRESRRKTRALGDWTTIAGPLQHRVTKYPVTSYDPVAATDLQTTDGVRWPGPFTVG